MKKYWSNIIAILLWKYFADFGILLGNRIYIKEITNSKLETNGGPQLQEGDVILKINNQPAENLSLKEAKKLIESSKEKLHLTVRREARSSPYSIYSNTSQSKGWYRRTANKRFITSEVYFHADMIYLFIFERMKIM